MNVAGHLAFAFLATEPLQARQRTGLRPTRDIALDIYVMFGALIPDLIDKPLRLIGFTPHGRSIGHALVVWALFTCLALFASTMYPKARAWSLLAYGWATHFVADTLDDLVAGLQSTGYLWTSWTGWPWTTQDTASLQIFDRLPGPCFSGLETATLLLVLIAVLIWSRKCTDNYADIFSKISRYFGSTARTE